MTGIRSARSRLLAIVLPLVAVSVALVALIVAYTILPGQQPIDDALTAPAGTKLIIRATHADVEVSAGQTNRVEVRLTGQRSSDAPVADLATDGSRLTLGCPSGFGFSCGLRATITVPARTAIDIRIDRGDLHTDRLNGAQRLHTGSGNVTVDSAAGQFSASTTSGNIQLTGTGTVLQASTHSGNIDLATREPTTVKATSGSGNIAISVRRPCRSYALDIKQRSPSVQVGVPIDPASPRTIAATATHGAVQVGCD